MQSREYVCNAACWLEMNSFVLADSVTWFLICIGFPLEDQTNRSSRLSPPLGFSMLLFFFSGLDMKASCLRNMINFINFKQRSLVCTTDEYISLKVIYFCLLSFLH